MDVEHDAFIIEPCMLCVYMVMLMDECVYVRVSDDDNDNECSFNACIPTKLCLMFVYSYRFGDCDECVMECDCVLIEYAWRQREKKWSVAGWRIKLKCSYCYI